MWVTQFLNEGKNMVTLLSKLFIKDYQNIENEKVRQSYGMLCGCLGIFLNLLLFAGKMLAGILSGSIAITADAFNNLSDAGSSIVTLFGFILAGQKPDSDHPFGHGRFEYISGLVVSFFILLMAFELLQDSFNKILHPVKPECNAVVLLILLASISIKGYMAYYNKSIGRRIKSVSMSATAMDSLSDIGATSAVFLSILFTHFTND